MAGRELLDTEHAETAVCELMQRGAAHCAKSHHNDVVCVSHDAPTMRRRWRHVNARARSRNVLSESAQGVAVAVIVTGSMAAARTSAVFVPAIGPIVHFTVASPDAFVNTLCGAIAPPPPVI